MRRRIVSSERETLDVSGPTGSVCLELVDVRGTVPQESRVGDAVELDPLVRAGQRMEASLQVDIPVADLEVEIMLAVALRGGVAGGQRVDTQGGRRQRKQGNEYSHARDL